MPRKKTAETDAEKTPKRAKSAAPAEPAPEETLVAAPDPAPAASEAPDPAPAAPEALAPEPEADEPEDTEAQAQASSEWFDKMVVFFLGDQRYGLPISVVQEIQQLVAFSEVPQQGGAVVGMVNLRGAVIPALDMRRLVGLPTVEYRLETPMIMCRARGILVAVIVDEVEDVLTMPEGCLQAAPPMHALATKMIGVCRMQDHLIYLLEADELLAGLGRGF